MTPPAQAFEAVSAPVTRTQIVRFAGAAGDFNPMHHDEEFARAAGQPSVFAMGQLTAAILADAVAGWFGAERITGYGVRFRDKVWPGDALVLTAMPDGAARYAVSAARASDGTEVVTGWVTIRVVGDHNRPLPVESPTE
jgi:acyl dehydratase